MGIQAAVAKGVARPPLNVLFVATTHWPFTTRLCLAMADSGLDVRAIAPKHHALHKMSSIATERLGHSRREAIKNISLAILRHAPRLIIPGDEMAIDCLRTIYARSIRGLGSDPSRLAQHIEESVGSPSSFVFSHQKSRFVCLAREEGLLVPATEVVRDIGHLRELIADRSFPLVLKCDDSFGGQGVRIVADRRAAERAFFELRAFAGRRGALKQAIKRFDVAPVERFWRKAPTITLQTYVNGRPANRAILCRRGEVLAGLSVEVVQTVNATGPATVVRVIDSPEITADAARLTRRLGLSGFVGFDFMLEGASDRPYLIEMNMRPTQICHLAFDAETDLIGAFTMSLLGTRPRRRMLRTGALTIALFPQESWRDPASPHLRSAYHDVPWQSPEFLEAYRSPVPADPNWLKATLEYSRHILQRFRYTAAPINCTAAGDSAERLTSARSPKTL